LAVTDETRANPTKPKKIKEKEKGNYGVSHACVRERQESS
jgi:hypothetical protein